MDCAEFLKGYSDFVDGRLEAHPVREYREHLAGCRSCAQYHAIVRRGQRLIRDLDVPEPSPDFLSRLEDRIIHMQAGLDGRHDSSFAGTAAVTALLAAALVVGASMGTTLRGARTVELPPVVIETPPSRTVVPIGFTVPADRMAARRLGLTIDPVLVANPRLGTVPRLSADRSSLPYLLFHAPDHGPATGQLSTRAEEDPVPRSLNAGAATGTAVD